MRIGLRKKMVARKYKWKVRNMSLLQYYYHVKSRLLKPKS